jgi:hypothetical protein
MRFSKSYYAIGVKLGKLYGSYKAEEAEARKAEQAERRAVIGITRALPIMRKKFATKEQAEAALAKVKGMPSVTKWLEVNEQSDVFF